MTHIHGEKAEPRILYAGDDDLDRAAQYLGSVLHDAGYAFDYVPSTERLPSTADPSSYHLIILSDYPAHQLDDTLLAAVGRAVRDGSALLMIGGWESFHGMNGEYSGTPIEDVLPVHLERSDDRRNLSQGCVVLPTIPSVFARSLDWAHPPIVGGFNAIRPRAGSRTLLHGRALVVRGAEHPVPGLEATSEPLLVSSPIGKGFAVALAFDLAPHWVGGFVDWGLPRVGIRLNDQVAVEVGHEYREFIRCLIRYCLDQGNDVP